MPQETEFEFADSAADNGVDSSPVEESTTDAVDVAVSTVEEKPAAGNGIPGWDPSFPDPAEVLVPKISQKWALTRSHLLMLCCVLLFFMYHNYLKLFHSDFWGHVSYGTWILEHHELPTESLFAPLTEGVPAIDTAWGAQVILGWIAQSGNDELFSHLFAATVLASYAVFTWTCWLKTRSLPNSLICCAALFLIIFSRHAVIRPEMFATLCFVTVLLVSTLTDSARRRLAEDAQGQRALAKRPFLLYCTGLFVLFLLWANLHGSFFVGFAVLGAGVAGRAVDVLWSERNFAGIIADRLFQQRCAMLWVAFAGTLVNPYGIDLHVYTLIFPSNPNLKDIFEWYLLEVFSLEAPSVVFSFLLAAVVLRHSRRRFTASDVILFLVFVTAMCMRVRMIQWYAYATVFVLAPHIHDCLQHMLKPLRQGEWAAVLDWLEVRSFRHTMLAGFLLWVAFCFSPVSVMVMGGKGRLDRHIYTVNTPRGVTDYFREHKPQGLIANPQWWGDWLHYRGPEGIQVLMTTNAVHTAPETVWNDYLAIARGEDGLEARLNRYRINTVVVSKADQRELLRKVRNMSGWEIVYNDDIATVASRNGLLPRHQPDRKDESQSDSVSPLVSVSDSSNGDEVSTAVFEQ